MAGAAVVGGLLILGSIVAAVVGGGGGDEPATPTERPPWLQPIPVPGEGIAWEDVDNAMCLEYAAIGEANAQRLLDGVLKRVWPAVPWPARPDDHPSVRQVQMLVGGRVSTFVNRVEAGQAVCQTEPPPPPPPGAVTDLSNYLSGHAKSFFVIGSGSNPTAMVRAAYSLPATATKKAEDAIACVTTVGYNLLLFGRPRQGPDYGRGKVNGKWFDIIRAWNPIHQDPRVAVAAHLPMQRQVDWGGGAIAGNPGSFGVVWVPPVLQVANTLVCTGGDDPWAPERNPPPEVLAALGLTLAGMKASWESSPNA